MNEVNPTESIPVWEKICLSINEAASYTGIGINKLRQMCESPTCDFVIWCGNKRIIKRKKLEEYLEKVESI